MKAITAILILSIIALGQSYTVQNADFVRGINKMESNVRICRGEYITIEQYLRKMPSGKLYYLRPTGMFNFHIEEIFQIIIVGETYYFQCPHDIVKYEPPGNGFNLIIIQD